MLLDRIGIPSMLEQTAEECAELAHACLKLSRYLRKENPTYVNGTTISDQHTSYRSTELYSKLAEEMADLFICLGELSLGDVVSIEFLDDKIQFKMDRMKKRWEYIDNAGKGLDDTEENA